MSAGVPIPTFYRYLDGLDLPDEAESRAILNDPAVGIIDRDRFTDALAALPWTERQHRIADVAFGQLLDRHGWHLTARSLAARAGCSKTYADEVLRNLEGRGMIAVSRPDRCIAGPDGPCRLPNTYWLTTAPSVTLTPWQRWAAAVVRLLVSMGREAAWAASLVRRGRHGAGEILKYLRLTLPGLLRSGHTRVRARVNRLVSSVPWVRQLALPLPAEAHSPSRSGHRTLREQSFKHARTESGGSGGERSEPRERANPAIPLSQSITEFASTLRGGSGAATGRVSRAERQYDSTTGRLRAQHRSGARANPPPPAWYRPPADAMRPPQQASGASPSEVDT